MTNEMPYNAWVAPPPTEIPNYVWSKKYDPKPLKIKSSKLIEIKVEEFYHPSKEVALKAAKMAVRGKSGMYFGSMENGKGFHVYRNGKVFRDIGWNLDEKKWLERKSYIKPDCSYTPLTRDPDRLEMVDEGVRI